MLSSAKLSLKCFNAENVCCDSRSSNALHPAKELSRAWTVTVGGGLSTTHLMSKSASTFPGAAVEKNGKIHDIGSIRPRRRLICRESFFREGIECRSIVPLFSRCAS